MKRIFQVLDPLQITGFAISVAVPLFLLITGKDQISSVTLGFVLASFTQLLDLQVRQSDSERRLLSSKALNEILYRDEWLLDSLSQIASDYQRLESRIFDPFEFKTHAREYLRECRDRLGYMSSGYAFPIERIPFEQSMIALKKAQKHISAVDSGDLDFWENTNANKYIKLNEETQRRGIAIKRVFIHPIVDLATKIDLLKKQQGLGIEIYIVDPTRRLPQALNGDYIVADDSFAVLSVFGTDGKVVGNKVSIEQGEVEQLVRNFDRLLNYALTLDEMISELSGNP
jgi:hypothetical protein